MKEQMFSKDLTGIKAGMTYMPKRVKTSLLMDFNVNSIDPAVMQAFAMARNADPSKSVVPVRKG